jgi:tRNA(Arg) A34 adenosine deaminase TadA
MALVHSRVRRVVFGLPDIGMGGLGGPTNVQNAGIHSLPGTNHHYRAFRVDIDKCEASDETMLSLRESLIKLHNDLI